MTGPIRLAALALFAAAPFADAAPGPQPDPMPPPTPVAHDSPFRGTLRIDVDATDLARHIFTVHEIIPVSGPGDTVLLYPQWIPGNHGPTGPLELFGGLTVRAGNATLDWRRDPVNVYAFHVPVPAGATTITADYQYLSPVQSDQGRVVMTPDMLDLQWNTVVLYPAGTFLRDIQAAATVHLPAGWQFGTALGPASSAGADNTVTFRTLPLNVLLDSPLIAGRNFERLDLDPGGRVPVHLDIVADRPAELAVSPAQLADHRAVVQQAAHLFGSHHYDHYDFLLALSDELGGEGLEHHRSSEDATGGKYFTEWDKRSAGRDLLSHEYTHSWNGKYKRPDDLWAADLNTPERDSLLWVYEGGTEYWGQILAARSGLWDHAQALDALAADAALEQNSVGRAWRPLADTTNDPIFVRRRSIPWTNWQREEDYYIEGALIWLDADTLIRKQTGGAKSLDDFAHAFFGTDDGSYVTSTYRFDDVVRALNAVTPYDWAGFLHTRLDARGGTAPLDGITRGGYRLAYTDEPNSFLTSVDTEHETRDFTDSIGLTLKKAAIVDVSWGSPAWKAGLTEGSTIIGLNGMTFEDVDDLTAAIRDAARTRAPIQMLVQSGKHYRLVEVDDTTGLRYPHLIRTGTGSATLDAIIAARK